VCTPILIILYKILPKKKVITDVAPNW